MERIQQKIAHMQVGIQCKNIKQYIKYQTSLLHRLKKKYGNSKMITFTTKLSILKQELKSKVEKRRHHKRLAERKRINNQLFYNPKKVCRSLKEDAISIEKVPTKESVESWKGIWQKGTIFNDKADWLPQQEKTYCNDVSATEYNINRTILDMIIQNIQINKAPVDDSITGYWYKHLTTYRDHSTELFQTKLVEYFSYCVIT